MRKLTVYKNVDGYGPKRRPKLRPGAVRNLVSDDGVVNKLVKVIRVPADKAGDRCADCDLNAGGRDCSSIMCLCNSHSLEGGDSMSFSICTLKPSRGYNDGVFVVFKDLDKVMESL